jgi:hypothetical protein
MLPKGSKYDLFRGTAPVAAIEDEKFPTKNYKIIKVWVFFRFTSALH